MSDSAKFVIEVVGGLIPGQPEPEFTKRWAITSAEWESALADKSGNRARALLAGRSAEADTYAQSIRNPNRLNWVRTDWIWL